MKRGVLSRVTTAEALDAAIDAIGDMKASGERLISLNVVYETLVEAREALGVRPWELTRLTPSVPE